MYARPAMIIQQRVAFARVRKTCVAGLAIALAALTQHVRAQDNAATPNAASNENGSSAQNAAPNDRQKHGKKKPIATVDVVRANLEPAYIAYPFSISGLDPLIFESNVIAHFMVNRPSWPVALVLSPKIVVRMFNQYSSPVKSPSYMPRLTAYFWFDQEVPRDQATFYGSVMLSHHSNGQAGNFFNADGSINHDNGSFSTNYFEFTAYGSGIWDRWFGWSSLSLEWHPGFNENAELKDRYGLVRAHFASTVIANLPLKGQINLRLSAILDRFQRASSKPFVREMERFPISLRYTMSIPGIDLGLYVGYYFGHDYYNIYFDRLIHTVQLGISGSVTPGLLQDPDE
jgi:hypothetical protein